MSPNRFLEAEQRVAVRRGDARRAYLETHIFELALAIVAIAAAASFFLNPDALAASAIGRVIHPLDYAWNGLYLAGGLLIVVGLARPSHRLELAGLIMFGAAIVTAAMALVALGGAPWSLKVISLGTYLAVAVGCGVRIGAILRVDRALAEVREELELRGVSRREGDNGP